MTTIKCGRSVFNLMASEADEYPALADVASDKGTFSAAAHSQEHDRADHFLGFG